MVGTIESLVYLDYKAISKEEKRIAKKYKEGGKEAVYLEIKLIEEEK